MTLFRRDIDYVIGAAIAPCNLRKPEVEAYAESVGREFDFRPGNTPAELVSTLRGRIHFQDIDDWLDEENGSIFVHGSFDFDICLPTYTSSLRDNFTVAHELGHYFLHSDQGKSPIVAFRSGSTRIEWEANWFAAALLMPRGEFQRVCGENKSIAYLASYFGVSQDAARVRKEAIDV